MSSGKRSQQKQLSLRVAVRDRSSSALPLGENDSRETRENCSLLGYCATNSVDFLPTFRDKLLKMGPIGCPETKGLLSEFRKQGSREILFAYCAARDGKEQHSKMSLHCRHLLCFDTQCRRRTRYAARIPRCLI